MDYGIISLIPVLVLLVVAVLTKKTASSLLIGSAVAFIIMSGTGCVYSFLDASYVVGMDGDTVWMMLVLVFVGTMIGLLQATGASKCFVNILEKRVHSERSLFLWSWLLVIVLFIDDMVRTPMLGQLIPLYDKYKVPRASLAYLADSTGTTVATLIPITNWAVFYQGVFGDFDELKDRGSSWDLYIQAIPFMFYAIVATVIVFLFTMGIIPKLGSMKKTYRIAKATGQLYSERSKQHNQIIENNNIEEKIDKIPLRLLCFFGTIILLTICVIKFELLIGLMVASVALVVVSFITRISNWNKLMSAAFSGIQNILPMLIILFCAYMFRNAVTDMGLPDYIISVAKPYLTPEIFPCISFVICCFLTFFTGSNWGVTAVYAAIGIPLCVALGANPSIVIAAIVSGATFGAHICFYTDYTVYASMMTKIDNMEHALTQLPYGLIGGAISAILFLVSGFMFS